MKVDRVNRRKKNDSQKKVFYALHDCHDKPRDLVRVDAITPITLWLRPPFQSNCEPY